MNGRRASVGFAQKRPSSQPVPCPADELAQKRPSESEASSMRESEAFL
jgi:hypothetical protein